MALRGIARVVLAMGLAAPAAGSAQSVPDRTIEVRLEAAGFRPAVLRLERGETARLRVRVDEGEHCFAVDEFRVEKRLRPGQDVTVDLTPERPGTFRFHCCLETGAAAEREHGRLIVSE